jgi:hypothetical protein
VVSVLSKAHQLSNTAELSPAASSNPSRGDLKVAPC